MDNLVNGLKITMFLLLSIKSITKCHREQNNQKPIFNLDFVFNNDLYR